MANPPVCCRLAVSNAQTPIGGDDVEYRRLGEIRSLTTLGPMNGYVLAGGKSSRMGRDKGLLHIGDQPLILRAVEILQPIVARVTLLAPPERYGNLGVPAIGDLWPDQGPLAALCTGLIHSDRDWNLFLACDLPRVSPRVIGLLSKRIRATPSDAVVPRTRDGWQPLCAAYHRRCRAAFERAIHQRRLSVVKLLDEIHPEAITVEELGQAGIGEEQFVNVNTPEEWGCFERSLNGTS